VREPPLHRHQGQRRGEGGPVLRRQQLGRRGADQVFGAAAEPGAEGARGEGNAASLIQLDQHVRRGEGEGDEAFAVGKGGWHRKVHGREAGRRKMRSRRRAAPFPGAALSLRSAPTG
jgi:hypothetical protein